MSFITSSKLFRASTEAQKNKILAAVADPINKPLVQQLESYVKVSDITHDGSSGELSSGKVDSANNDATDASPVSSDADNADPSAQKNAQPSEPLHFALNDDSKSDDESSDSTQAEGETESADSIDKTDESDSIHQAASIDNKQLIESATTLADTYITIDKVSTAINELPGALNLQDDTKGVAYAALRTNANGANEVWVYYNQDVDVTKMINPVVTYLFAAGYYYLEFNRVSRPDNALVFIVNWISNYFNVKQMSNEQK